MTQIIIERIQLHALSAAIAAGPESSLASMPTRNALLVEVTTTCGATGWGEAWCNFPPRGSLARLSLIADVIGPALLGRSFAHYPDLRPFLEEHFARMIIHTGEAGPFAHCFAAIDMAVADIAARRAGLSLSRLLNPDAGTSVPVYASSPDRRNLPTALRNLEADGHTAAKLKIGYGMADDQELLRRFRELAPPGMQLFVDVNQNWELEEGLRAVEALAQFDIDFLEEPLRADAPLSHWKRLADASPIRLAAGENICSAAAFHAFVAEGGLRVVQPDVAKWGGVSAAYQVGCRARAQGATCAIHFMGSALGLATSLNVLAAIGGDGRVEVDVNPNALRTDLGEIDLFVEEGRVRVPARHGIGFIPDPEAIAKYRIAFSELH